MRRELLYRHGIQEEYSVCDLAERALVEDRTLVSRAVSGYLKRFRSIPVVVSGFRCVAEVQHLNGERHYLRPFRNIFVETSRCTRSVRFRERPQFGDDSSAGNFGNFMARDRQERRLGLLRLRKFNRTVILYNEEGMETFEEKIDRELGFPVGLNRPSRSFAKGIARIKPKGGAQLEDAILVALLGAHHAALHRSFYSVSEITSMVNSFRSASPARNVQEIQHYFNDEFRAYYEMKRENCGNVSYRLSNTGVSLARWRLLRE